MNLRSRKKINMFQIKNYGKSFESHYSVVSRLNVNNGKIYPCPKCDKLFIYLSCAIRHRLKHFSPCFICKLKFTEDDMIDHLSKEHKFKIVFVCMECFDAIINKKLSTDKSILYVEKKKEDYICDLCNRK